MKAKLAIILNTSLWPSAKALKGEAKLLSRVPQRSGIATQVRRSPRSCSAGSIGSSPPPPAATTLVTVALSQRLWWERGSKAFDRKRSNAGPFLVDLARERDWKYAKLRAASTW
jgi:hypothetical protein